MIVILGSNGKLGTALRSRMDEQGIEYFTVQSGESYSLFPGDIVVNCRAMTDVERCEYDIPLAKKLNHFDVEKLAMSCAEAGARLIHISTDYVFDGNLQEGYTELDCADPKNVYGSTKRLGEIGIASVFGDYNIIRTSFLYGGIGSSFVLKILESLRYKGKVNVTSGIYCTPTNVYKLADFIISVIGGDLKDCRLLHYSGFEEVSLVEYAKLIQYYSGLQGMINPIEYKNNPTLAYRPKCTSLYSQYKNENHFYDDLKEYVRSIV